MKYALALSFITATAASCTARSYGQISFSWSLADSAANAVICVTGQQVQIEAGAYVAAFPCSDGHGTTDDIATGRDSIIFNLLDPSGAVESTATQTLTIPDNDVVTANPIIFTVTPAEGEVTLNWSLEDTSGDPVDCVDGETVQLVIEGIAPIAAFTCVAGSSSGSGNAPDVPVGTYLSGTASLLLNGQPKLDNSGHAAQYPIPQIVVSQGETTTISAIFTGLPTAR